MRGDGKKIGQLEIVLDRQKTRYRKASISVDLRIRQDGTFVADYEGHRYTSQTQDDLRAQLKVAATKTLDVEWKRYLVVQYEARACKPFDFSCSTSYGLGADRAELAGNDLQGYLHEPRRLIVGIDLRWNIMEFTEPYALPEDSSKTVRMEREIDEEGEVGSASENDNDELPLGTVLWTAERQAFLVELQAAIGKLDAKMVALFGNPPDILAAKIDGARADRLLGGGEPEPLPYRTITPELLATIRVIYCAPETLSLYGIPYEMRPGQAPRDIRTDLRGDWIWLGSPGWWGMLSKIEQDHVRVFLDARAPKGTCPENPNEWIWLR